MRGEPITADFALDEGFRRFYARFTISKVPMGMSALLSVPWVALKLAEPVLVAEDPLVSFWVILLIPAEIILLLELLGSHNTWLGAVRLQRSWIHLLDGEWHGGDPTLHLSVHGGHADVTLMGYGPPADGGPKQSPQWGVSASLASYRKLTPIDGRHELGDVTAAIWGETYALLLLGGRSRLFRTVASVRLPVARARVIPAVPIGLAQIEEVDRRRLRRALERRGIPIREVHDEGWARRALRALKVRRRERSR
ncbi:hypothetical protein J2S71_001184 [Olsenella profusa DSM 13989]|uniref:hypothetical protein n=1 Tax=Olsenella profusa TaxID=138595 RepID=UPI0027843631|nr:hypothetical protein [Olsenella profusa]MDP9859488.1 hypothetical protein [Olsenella profusa DSM 13989]